MNDNALLLLTGHDVATLLTIEDCIAAVEDVFARYGRRQVSDPAVLGVHAETGGFHIKAAVLPVDGRAYFAAKTNANFPDNPKRFGLPTIQGLVLLFDANDGRPLAVLDSMELTIQRTAAATAVAAKHLARRNSSTLAICGCGAQAAAQVKAVRAVLPIRRVLAFDLDRSKAEAFSGAPRRPDVGLRGEVDFQVANSLEQALAEADVLITCTPSRQAFVKVSMVRPGTFLAAVGADNPEKQEIEPALLKQAKVVADMLDQCAAIGDLHHAIDAGLMTRADVHAELGAVVAGLAPGRESDDEIIVFDSTGTALQDVAAAAIVYRKAQASGAGTRWRLGG